MGKRMLQGALAGQSDRKRTRGTVFTTHQSDLMGTPDGCLGHPMMGTPHGYLDRPMMSTPLPTPDEIIIDLCTSLPFTPVNRDEGEELNHGDNRANAGESTRAGDGDLWVYDEELLGDKDFPCGLQVVPKKFNDMKMFSVLFVKFKCPSIEQDRCIKAVQDGYRVLVERWLESNQEHDATVLNCADRLRKFAITTVRRRVNTLLRNASSKWPIIKNKDFSYKTFETPRHGRLYESQETLDCLKAAIIKNAKEQHEKHKAKAPTSCESLLDAVRPDKVAKVVLQDVLATNEVFRDLPSVPESMEDVSPERVDEVQRTLEFSLHDEFAIPSEDWHEPFPSIECDMNHEDILYVNFQDFGSWELGQGFC